MANKYNVTNIAIVNANPTCAQACAVIIIFSSSSATELTFITEARFAPNVGGMNDLILRLDA